MAHYIITTTTVETLGIECESLGEANIAAKKGEGTTITIQTTINVRPRPEPQVRVNPSLQGPVPPGFAGHVPQNNPPK